MEKILSQSIDTLFEKPALFIPMVVPAIAAGTVVLDILWAFWHSGFNIQYFESLNTLFFVYVVLILCLLHIFFLLMEGLLIYRFMKEGEIDLIRTFLQTCKIFPIFFLTFFLFLAVYIGLVLPFSLLVQYGGVGVIVLAAAVTIISIFMIPLLFYLLPSTADGHHFHNAFLHSISFLRRDFRRGISLGLLFSLISIGVSAVPVVGTILQYIFLIPFFTGVMTIYYLMEEKGEEYKIEVGVRY